MNADLERELVEFPELAPVVARLRAGRGEVGRTGVLRVWGLVPSLLAASLVAVLGLSVWFRAPSAETRVPAPPAYGACEYRETPEEMIASQRADGSWQNDFLTRRNAEALRLCGTPAAQVAYKKAMRNLRVRGRL